MAVLSLSRFIYMSLLIIIINIPAFLGGYFISQLGFNLIKNHTEFLNLKYTLFVLASCALLSALIFIMLISKLDRKKVFLIIAILYIFLSSILFTSFSFFSIFIFASIIGISSVIVPIYLGEIFLLSNHNKLVFISPLFLLAGIGLNYITYHFFNSSGGYIQYIIVSMAILYFILAFIIPESPFWLIKTKHEDLAIINLIKLKGNNYHVELAELKSIFAKLNKINTNRFSIGINIKVIVAILVNLILVIGYILCCFSFKRF